MSYIDELEARFPTKGVTLICEVQAMRHGEACATVDCLRVSIAASRARCEELEKRLAITTKAIESLHGYSPKDIDTMSLHGLVWQTTEDALNELKP